MSEADRTGMSGSEPNLHPLRAWLEEAVLGRFPPADGGVTALPPLASGREIVMAFTGHSMIASDLSQDALLDKGATGFGGAVDADFLRWLAGPDGRIGSHDVVLVARGTGHDCLEENRDLDDHPRVRHARSLRSEVRVFGDPDAFIAIGRGVVDRYEVSVEVAPAARCRGCAHALLRSALGVIPRDETLYAEVAPGNAASLRAFLAAGFVPIGAEVLVFPDVEARRATG